MDKAAVTTEICRIVAEQWSAKQQPVLLSNLPRALEKTLGQDYRLGMEGLTLKKFLETAPDAQVKLVQDPTLPPRLGAIPADQDYEFPELSATKGAQITSEDAQAFSRVLASMSADEQRTTMLPASLVARLLNTR